MPNLAIIFSCIFTGQKEFTKNFGHICEVKSALFQRALPFHLIVFDLHVEILSFEPKGPIFGSYLNSLQCRTVFRMIYVAQIFDLATSLRSQQSCLATKLNEARRGGSLPGNRGSFMKWRMKHFLAAALALIAAPAAAAPLDAVAASLKATTSLAADFSQTGPDGKVLTGKFTLARPGKVRFEYTRAPLLIVADGKTLTMVDYQVAQVSQWPVRSTPLGILLASDPDLSGVARVTADAPAGLVVEARDAKHPEFGVLAITFARKAPAPGGLELSGWTARDAQGGTTEVRLTNARYNADIGKTSFRFRDPRSRIPGRVG